MIGLDITILSLIGAVSMTVMAVVYLCFHSFRDNVFTWWLATLSLSFSVIMDYVGYNVLAVKFGGPPATGTWAADAVYGLIALVGVMGDYVFIRETVRQRKAKRKAKL